MGGVPRLPGQGRPGLIAPRDMFYDQRESNGPLIGFQEHYRHGLAALVEDFSKVGRIASIMAVS